MPPITRTDNKQPLPSMDFSSLLQMGMDACQALGGDIWTDYNEHDPGLTILEQLCYAITDLAYRVNYPVADILAQHPHLSEPGNNTLFTGDTVLCCEPLTPTDYRKFVFDQARSRNLYNFKNLWLTSAGNGLYDAQIETWDGNDDPIVVGEVQGMLETSRNLCEGIASIRVMPTFGIPVEAVVVVSSACKPDTVLAEILYRLQNALVPFVHTQTIDSLMSLDISPDKIFVGPRLNLGFIGDDQFAPLPASISLLDLSATILGVPGVQSIISLNVSGSVNGSIALPPGVVPRLTPSIFATPMQPSPIKLLQQGKPCAIDQDQVATLLTQRLAGIAHSETYALRTMQESAYCQLPQGQFRNIAQYYSIQHQFPLTYGIGDFGVQLPQSQSELTVVERTARIAQAKQLKAFLLFFEQVLTDGFNQLAQAARLLSLDSTLNQSYFWQSLVKNDGPPDLLKLNIFHSPQQPPQPDDRRYTVQISGTDAELLVRSRDYNSLADAEAAQQTMLALGQDSKRYQVRALPNGQSRLLLDNEHGHVVGFGCQRYTSQIAAENEVPSLAEFFTLLAQDAAMHQRLVGIASRGTLGIRLIDSHDQLLLQADELNASEQEQRIAQILQLGIHADNYRIVPGGGADLRLSLCDRNHVQIADGVEKFATEDDARSGIAALVALIQSLCCNPAAQARHILRVPKRAPIPAQETALAYYEAGTELIVRRFDPYVKRRNRFLDHLLARFGEHFPDLELAALERQMDTGASERESIKSKIDFLRLYPLQANQIEHADASAAGPPRSLGAGRFMGGNAATNESPVLAQRVKLLLGFRADEQEDMHVIEHVLLHPSNATAAQSRDPFYAFRISVLLPDWPQRFQNPSFRSLTEQTLFENCPAHVQADCYWLNKNIMARFLSLQERLIRLLNVHPAKNPVADLADASAALVEFIKALASSPAAQGSEA